MNMRESHDHPNQKIKVLFYQDTFAGVGESNVMRKLRSVLSDGESDCYEFTFVESQKALIDLLSDKETDYFDLHVIDNKHGEMQHIFSLLNSLVNPVVIISAYPDVYIKEIYAMRRLGKMFSDKDLQDLLRNLENGTLAEERRTNKGTRDSLLATLLEGQNNIATGNIPFIESQPPIPPTFYKRLLKWLGI